MSKTITISNKTKRRVKASPSDYNTHVLEKIASNIYP